MGIARFVSEAAVEPEEPPALAKVREQAELFVKGKDTDKIQKAIDGFVMEIAKTEILLGIGVSVDLSPEQRAKLEVLSGGDDSANEAPYTPEKQEAALKEGLSLMKATLKIFSNSVPSAPPVSSVRLISPATADIDDQVGE